MKCFAGRYKCSSSITTPSELNMSRSNTAQSKYCKMCHDAGKSEAEFTSHYVKDKPGPGGKVCCPYLLSLVCQTCKGNGHTRSHCPVTKDYVANVARQKQAEYARAQFLKGQKTATQPTKPPAHTNPFALLSEDTPLNTPKAAVLVPKTPVLVPKTPVLVPKTPVLVPKAPVLVPKAPVTPWKDMLTKNPTPVLPVISHQVTHSIQSSQAIIDAAVIDEVYFPSQKRSICWDDSDDEEE
jgi:hypothetical protein